MVKFTYLFVATSILAFAYLDSSNPSKIIARERKESSDSECIVVLKQIADEKLSFESFWDRSDISSKYCPKTLLFVLNTRNALLCTLHENYFDLFNTPNPGDICKRKNIELIKELLNETTTANALLVPLIFPYGAEKAELRSINIFKSKHNQLFESIPIMEGGREVRLFNHSYQYIDTYCAGTKSKFLDSLLNTIVLDEGVRDLFRHSCNPDSVLSTIRKSSDNNRD